MVPFVWRSQTSLAAEAVRPSFLLVPCRLPVVAMCSSSFHLCVDTSEVNLVFTPETTNSPKQPKAADATTIIAATQRMTRQHTHTRNTTHKSNGGAVRAQVL